MDKYVHKDDYILPAWNDYPRSYSYSIDILKAKIERTLKDGRYNERQKEDFNYVRWLLRKEHFPFDKWNTIETEGNSDGIDFDKIGEELQKLSKNYNFHVNYSGHE